MLNSDELLKEFADALIVVTVHGTVLYWSRGAESVFGHEREDALGRPLMELVVPPDQRDEASRRMSAAVATGIASTFEAVRRAKDGSIVHVDVSLSPVRDESGEVARIAVSMKDVSRLQYLREATLVESKFRGLLEAAPDAMLLVNAEGRIVLLNAQAERVFGWTRDELLGRPVEVLVPAGVRATHPVRRAAFAADPRTRPMGEGQDLRGLRKDGTEFPAEISLSPVSTDGVMYVSAAVRDVSRRRKVESKFRGLLEAAPDAVVIVDRQGTMVLVNSQAERLFGYPRAEMIGRSVDMLVPLRLRDGHPAHRDHYFLEPRVRSMGSGLELNGVRKDGTEVPVEISLSPLETEDGVLVSAAIRDITQRRSIESALKLANKELESFSYSVAHDLRAPLRAMNGFAQILLDDYGHKLDADGRDCLNEIRANAVRMAALIDALLSLSRVTRSEVHPAVIDISALARAAAAQCAAAEPERSVDVVVEDHLQATGDATLVRQLIDNLISNAWKFTARADGARIEFGRVVSGERPFFVRDNGAGFDMAHAGKLFGAFQRLHTVGEFAGTGIGLATAQRIISRHRGRIWAEAAVGAGATFWFTLPDERARGTT